MSEQDQPIDTNLTDTPHDRFHTQDFSGEMPDEMLMGVTVPDAEYGNYFVPLGKAKSYDESEKLPEGKAGEHQLIAVRFGRFVLPNDIQHDFTNPAKVDVLYHLLSDTPAAPLKSDTVATSGQ